ncbi:AAA family ATPase [Lederbergia wuyishanensis]|uniref:Uncharacterized protein YhaN n=1 Tax=Lederbergia wuyishanensis TaxID=1347903 RepID=A0ABU0CYP1_9BACI|nr:AAA family ATPase [Lederbergia wuyishanensis]MCJ8005895.1 AAA family ATPase [Lederbergia wuyishanensis]MDQ0341261.1 uncharacterized protein YhaN [Lederbergia wuyishanensis]
MKIKSLHIYGYGKFIDFYIEDFSDIQIIFGENEAGKSTIMSFIHSILFGFSSRQQPNLRYEPKNHSAYGGRVTIESEERGEVIIERVKGKSAGNVTVILKNGMTGGEDPLFELLGGMNRTLYENIFSFNLQGIQEVQKLKSEEINRYLVASGTMGTDILLNVEQSFQKELDQLFKPNGRKPRLNEMISLLRDSEKDLQKAKQKNAEYSSLIIKKEATVERVNVLQNELLEITGKLQKINEIIEKWEKIQELNLTELSMEKIGTNNFPTDGLKRYENINEKIIEITSRLKTLQEKIENNEKRIEENTPLASFQSMIFRAEKALMEWPIYEQLELEIISLKREVMSYKDQVEKVCRELNYENEPFTTILTLNLGIDMKGKIKDCLNEKITIKTKLDSVQKQIEDTQTNIQELEAICEKIELNILPEQQLKELEKEKINWKNPKHLIEEKNEIEKTVKKNENESKYTNKALFYNYLYLLGAIGFIVWAFVKSEWLFAAFAGGVLVYTFTNLSILINRRKSSMSNINMLQERLQAISALMTASTEDRDPAQLYDEQLKYRIDLKNIDHQLDQKLQQMEQLHNQKSEIIAVLQRNQSHLDKIKEDLGLSIKLNDTRLEQAFDLMLELLKLIKETKKVEEELELKLRKQEQWVEELHEISHSARIEYMETREVIFQLKQLLQSEREKKLVRKDLLNKLDELREEKEQLKLELQEYVSLKNQLYKLTQTNNEEEFRQNAKQYNDFENLKERLEILHAQIGKGIVEEAKVFQTDMELKKRKIELTNFINEKSSILNKLRNELAALSHEIQVLEEGGTYSDKLHQFYFLKSTFNEEARVWAKYTMAKTILQKTMDKYIGERFPKVVSKAQEYMTFLTNSEYTRIHFLEDQNIVIERSDGQRFTPAELSQGTSEQLYTSLRLALVQVLYEDYPLPIIIDDGFVNFDKRRTEKVLELIETISTKTQVLLFTCHEHIRDYFSEQHVKMLKQTIKL